MPFGKAPVNALNGLRLKSLMSVGGPVSTMGIPSTFEETDLPADIAHNLEKQV